MAAAAAALRRLRGRGSCASQLACDRAPTAAYWAVPVASASGSGPGCQPFGWGAGFRAFSGLDDAVEAPTEMLPPARSGASGPRDAIGDPQQRLLHPAPMLEHQSGLRPTMTTNGSLIVDVVLAALDHEPLDGSNLECADDVLEAASTGLELTHAVAASTHHDERLDRPCGVRVLRRSRADRLMWCRSPGSARRRVSVRS